MDLHFLSMAQGSVGELETEIEIAGRLKYIDPEPLDSLLSRLGSLARQIRALRAALEKPKQP